ncbi:hypothetical protein IFR05_012436 [Cadophora sp. M221]|nr:hypothetical protein IFR05_012436 [Cadophora sp. M221]
MFTTVAEFENQAPILPIQSIPHPTSAEHNDVPEPNYTKSDGNMRGQEDERAKPNKKRKTKLLPR